MKDTTARGLELALDQFGNFNKYNLYNYCFLCAVIYCFGIHQHMFLFIAPDIKYRCNISECENTGDKNDWLKYAVPTDKGELSKCKRYSNKIHNTSLNYVCKPESFDNTTEILCNSFVYSEEDSIVKEFNLACEDWKRTLFGNVHFAGNLFVVPLIGISSDKYGRKITLIASVGLLGATCLIKSYLFNFETLLVLEFFNSGLALGTYYTAYIFAIESVKPGNRVLVSTMIHLSCHLGHVTFGGLAWLVHNWKSLSIVVGLLSLFFISYFWFLDESPRWLLSKGRSKEALVIINRAAKINKVELSSSVLSLLQKPKINEINKNNSENKIPLIAAIKSNVLRKKLIACAFLYFTYNFVYYGLTINSVSLAGDKYLNFTFIALAEIPADLLDRLGRKKTLMVSYILSGIFCSSLSFFTNDLRIWSIYFYLLGVICITLAFFSLYTYMIELFPTTVRQTMISTCSWFARIGSILSASTPLLASCSDYSLAIIFGSVTFLSAAVVFFLPETRNTILPNSIKESEGNKPSMDQELKTNIEVPNFE